MEGKGFEPTVEALFGENGFFPDTVLRTMYFVSDNMPIGTTEMLRNMLPALRKDRKKRQVGKQCYELHLCKCTLEVFILTEFAHL